MWSLGKQSLVFIQDEVVNSPPTEKQSLAFNSFVLSSEVVSNFVISTQIGLEGEQRWMCAGCKFRKHFYSLMCAERCWVSRYIKVKYLWFQSWAGSRAGSRGTPGWCQGWGVGSRGCSEPRQRLLPPSPATAGWRKTIKIPSASSPAPAHTLLQTWILLWPGEFFWKVLLNYLALGGFVHCELLTSFCVFSCWFK